MANMSHRRFTAGLLAAALAFRAVAEAEAEKARAAAAVGDAEAEPPEEEDEEVLWEKFQAYIADHGIVSKPGPEMNTIAGLYPGEPSFTLRGQDILASMMVRHWIALYEGLAPDASQEKIEQADAIAEKMEMYRNQQWAD